MSQYTRQKPNIGRRPTALSTRRDPIRPVCGASRGEHRVALAGAGRGLSGSFPPPCGDSATPLRDQPEPQRERCRFCVLGRRRGRIQSFRVGSCARSGGLLYITPDPERGTLRQAATPTHRTRKSEPGAPIGKRFDGVPDDCRNLSRRRSPESRIESAFVKSSHSPNNVFTDAVRAGGICRRSSRGRRYCPLKQLRQPGKTHFFAATQIHMDAAR